ncbi:MAG: ATP-binding cassette domain-containing protein [Streptosporangiales bacterium]|nr:ATP-binding cassette domain-containing protein [Streptosporangiales bacterium]
MKTLPLPDPGHADVRSPARYLAWVGRKQLVTIAGGSAFGIVWMVAQAVMPAIIGRGVDDGVTGRDLGALLGWGAVLLLAGGVQAGAGIARHRFAVTNWLTAAYRTVQLVVRHATGLGATLPKRVATGEVVSVGATDIAYIGNAMEVTGRLAGAVVSFVVVAFILLGSSMVLGLVVLIGVPVLVVALGPILRPLHRRQAEQRELTGRLNTLAGDIVAGLRVVRGIGGEDTFNGRYHAASQRVRASGVRVARVHSVLDALQILLPGVFVVFVTWLGARFAVAGQISAGELVAFYGYAAFLVMPLTTATEAVHKVTRALVASRRVVDILRIEPEVHDTARQAPPPADSVLVDVASGVRIEAGLLTVVATAQPAEGAAIADRLGRYVDADVRWGEVPLADVAVDEVRRRIVVHDTESRLFTGRLRDELDPTGAAMGEDVLAALRTASAEDVLEALDGGVEAQVEERGRTFSGGQRQRLMLARVLVADPEVLVLVEPTSAVDAHTEARIAGRLGAARAGRTTVVVSSSPLVLDRADRVVLVEDGRVTHEGTHRGLLAESQHYRAVVTREETEEEEVTA